MLVIDDDAEVAGARARLLKREGYDVEMAGSPQEGLDLATERAFDVLLIDARMPHMNGPEFAQRLRARGVSIPWVLVSGDDSAGETARSDGDAPSGTLLIPFDVSDLVAALKDAMWKLES